jgi:Isochorismatase family
MSENPNPITIDNSALILIDHQPWVAFSVQSIDSTLLVNNVAALATAAKAVDVPTIVTTVGASGGPLDDPPFSQISDVFPDQEPIDRVSTNAWEDIKPAVEATGRRVLLMAGIWTEVCLALDGTVGTEGRLHRLLRQRLLRRCVPGSPRRCQAADGPGGCQRHQLDRHRVRVDARLHERRTGGGHPRPPGSRRQCRPLGRVPTRQRAGPGGEQLIR